MGNEPRIEDSQEDIDIDESITKDLIYLRSDPRFKSKSYHSLPTLEQEKTRK